MVRDGYIYGLSLLAVAGALAWATGSWLWSLIPILLAAFFLWFFRDPQRAIPTGEGLVVSPADGLVTETVSIDTPEGPRQRISIFLNVFDVHVNRTPISGVITGVRYQKGLYLNAMNPTCAERNEQNIVTVRGEGIEIVFKQIAGLIFVSQQSTNAGSGFISRIDYTNGNLEVDSGNPTQPTIIQINDPNGRFGRPQSPDPRFSVDDANPTIHAATGYPMCVPRTISGDDALCPQKNRPKVVTPTTTNNCRNFSQAGVTPPTSGELSGPAVGQVYCSQYVMKRFSDASRTATDPDPTQQAPFEVGDFISWSGTLFKSTTTGLPDFISAHTIEANVGIYTQPGSQPSYLSIGEFGVGTADPAATAINGVAQETQDRIFLEASTTDIKTPVDIYLIDVNPSTGVQTNRWVTPYEMTGECNPALGLATSCLGASGGITTQNTGPQPQRARLRATKAPAGLLSQPTRTLRVVARSLCVPQQSLSQTAVDSCLQNAGRLTVANGLIAGQYVAPVFEFIFPEGVKPGDPVVPNDFWHLPFIRNGEGVSTPTGVGPLDPTPW